MLYFEPSSRCSSFVVYFSCLRRMRHARARHRADTRECAIVHLMGLWGHVCVCVFCFATFPVCRHISTAFPLRALQSDLCEAVCRPWNCFCFRARRFRRLACPCCIVNVPFDFSVPEYACEALTSYSSVEHGDAGRASTTREDHIVPHDYETPCRAIDERAGGSVALPVPFALDGVSRFRS